MPLAINIKEEKITTSDLKTADRVMSGEDFIFNKHNFLNRLHTGFWLQCDLFVGFFFLLKAISGIPDKFPPRINFLLKMP